MYSIKYFLASFIVGGLVGLSELISRYQDEPKRIFKSIPALLYIILNGVASLISYSLIDKYGVTYFKTAPDETSGLMLAGFSSMLFLRSSLFIVKINNQDIPIGPAAMLGIIMGSADRAFDRERAEDRAKTIEKIMKPVDFEKAKFDLPMVCLGLMQNLSTEEQNKLAQDVNSLSSPIADNKSKKAKSIMLGLTIIKYTGPKVLEEAIRVLGDEIGLQNGVSIVNKLDELIQKKAEEIYK